MKARDIISTIEELAAVQLQESFDNSGLLIGSGEEEVTGVLICLDVTMPVIDEAIEKGFNMIVSHHPMIFNAIKRINMSNVKDEMIVKAIKNDIVIYAAHTNIDSSMPGVSSVLGKALGLTNISILHPKSDFLCKILVYVPNNHADIVRKAIFNSGGGCIGNYDSCSFNSEGVGTFRGNSESNPFVGRKNELHQEPETRIEFMIPRYMQNKVLRAITEAHPYEEPAFDIIPLNNKLMNKGLGVVGDLIEPMSEIEFLDMVKATINLKALRHSKIRGRMIKRVALCGGSGSSFIRDAITANADIYLTAELKHNEFLDYQDNIVIADIGHYESECLIKNLIRDILLKKNSNFAIRISEAEDNPVFYI